MHEYIHTYKTGLKEKALITSCLSTVKGEGTGREEEEEERREEETDTLSSDLKGGDKPGGGSSSMVKRWCHRQEAHCSVPSTAETHKTKQASKQPTNQNKKTPKTSSEHCMGKDLCKRLGVKKRKKQKSNIIKST